MPLRKYLVDSKIIWRHLVDRTGKYHARRKMYGTSGMPDLIPPNGSGQAGPAGQFNTGHTHIQQGHNERPNPQRLGHRAPKLGQIGRSKKVDLGDEDVDDIMNNNRQFPVSLNLSPIS